MATKLVTKREELAVKQAALASIFEKAGEDIDLMKVDSMTGDSKQRASEVKRLNDELSALGVEVDELASLDRVAANTKAAGERMSTPASGMVHAGVAQAAQPERKSLGQMFTEAPEYKAGMRDGRPRFAVELPDADMKTLLTTSAGWAPYSPQTGQLVPFANRRPMVADVVPSSSTTASAIRYMEETTFTNNAAAVTEGDVKPEAALAFTERIVPVELIATWIPVTRQQLDDVPGIQALINDRLTLMLMLTEEVELLTGSGVTPHLTGFLTRPSIQTQAKGADPTPDAIFKAMTKIRAIGMAEPSAIIMHPNDWQDVRLLRTVDGIYIWGSPSEAGPERIWGLPVVVTTAETENTALVGDFQLYSHISRRMGVQIDVSDSHSDYFVRNQLAIRAEERLALEVYRQTAFCTVTGI